jgi:hypothetical protein
MTIAIITDIKGKTVWGTGITLLKLSKMISNSIGLL